MGWRSAQARIAGTTLSWRRSGAGPAVLYLHDAGADTLAAPLLDELAADHDIAVPDLPGYGGSGPPTDLDRPEAVAAVLASLLDAIGWQRAVLAGTSLGGWFALELALAHPDRVAGLVLCAAAGLQIPEDYLLSLFAGGHAAGGTEGMVRAALVERLAPSEQDVEERSPAVAAAVLGPFVQRLAAAASTSWHPATANPRLLGRLGEISCPTTVLWGEHDALIPLAHGRLLASGIAAARLVVVADAGHLLPLERPEVVAAAVRGITRRRP